jgi:hypothetical protein
MLDRPTVFVIGAGAGHGLKMPLGDRLSEIIADKVNIHKDGTNLLSGNNEILEIVERLARTKKIGLTEFISAGRMIASGVRHSRSIDNYVHTHRDKPMVGCVAKVAIVHTILKAERDSALWINPSKHPYEFQDEPSVRQSWMYDFFTLLQDQIIESENLDQIFDNLSIINFNYDRCIEHFLLRALLDLFPTKGEGILTELINEKLTIIHPYGIIGKLPWQTRQDAVPFGAEQRRHDIAQLSTQIRTYHEQITDNEELRKIRTLIADAERIIFLGFHFHKQNMELLTAQDRAIDAKGPASVFASQVNRSTSDMEIIEQRIQAMLNGRKILPGSAYKGGCDCKSFFRDFGTLLGGP